MEEACTPRDLPPITTTGSFEAANGTPAVRCLNQHGLLLFPTSQIRHTDTQINLAPVHEEHGQHAI